jgi:hypothetical protein
MQNKDKIPVEIITKRDIMNILDKLTIDFRTTLSSFMSEPIISIHANDKLVWIITQKDIFMQIARNLTMVTDFVIIFSIPTISKMIASSTITDIKTAAGNASAYIANTTVIIPRPI